ncbi:MAG: hypothetical protein COT15_05135 [Candidatus Diapherotrites archaeon CG08_land_8_20_14_0_20_34_12]|nr:MAG: hypothetical protein COT15_05135 [Candidatus Diapherotrites archaeon CG08_land_8_20_14_0_20_34_12]
MGLVKKRTSRANNPKKWKERTRGEGPAGRSLLKRAFLRSHRFAPEQTYDYQAWSTYEKGDPDFHVDRIGRAALGENDERRLKRMADAIRFRDSFYSGRNNVKIAEGTRLYERLREHLRVRKGDILEVTLPIIGHRAGNIYEDLYISVKSPQGRGQILFLSHSLPKDRRIYGELHSRVIDAIERGGTKLLPVEVERFREDTSKLYDGLTKLVRDVGKLDGDRITVKASGIKKEFEEPPYYREVAIPHLMGVANTLITGKRIVVERDIE